MEGVPLLDGSPAANGTRRKNRVKQLNNYDDSDDDFVARRFFDNNELEPYEVEESRQERRPIKSAARYLMICFGILFFLLLMYIPAYRQVDRQFGVIQGWSTNTSRDTRSYVLPDNITILNQPSNLCSEDSKEKIFLLIIVCSATENFEERRAIRETWANYSNYRALSDLSVDIKNWSKDLKLTDAMIRDVRSNFSIALIRKKRDTNGANVNSLNSLVRKKRQFISRLDTLVPGLRQALEDNQFFLSNPNVVKESENEVKNNFVTEGADPRFDFGSENGGVEKTVLGNKLGTNYEDSNEADYDDLTENSNIMKIPQRGFEDDMNLPIILNKLKKQVSLMQAKKKVNPLKKNSALESEFKVISSSEKPQIKNAIKSKSHKNFSKGVVPDFKVVFILGMPQNNSGDIQNKIDQEISEFDDIIQEGFVDTYNNLTLKSVMLLKWVNTQCNNNVQYVMKTDDDMFVNVPNLVQDLKKKSYLCPETRLKQIKSNQVNVHGEDSLLMGVVFCGARPILDPSNKWYSPRYMYGGRVYPCYLSGTGYVMTAATAMALYAAALDTPLFHLEDVYITGMCAESAGVKPITHYGFSHLKRADNVCEMFTSITAHGAKPHSMRIGTNMIQNRTIIQQCEIRRLFVAQQIAAKTKKTNQKYKYTKRTCI